MVLITEASRLKDYCSKDEEALAVMVCIEALLKQSRFRHKVRNGQRLAEARTVFLHISMRQTRSRRMTMKVSRKGVIKMIRRA